MKKKILLASGCSFTFETWCWPGTLSKKLNCDLLNVGMASQGNGLISRKAIYNVEKLLKKYNPEDILVGIMWSGFDRHEYYTNSNIDVKSWGSFTPDNMVIKNPTNVVDNNYNWRIMNVHWTNYETRLFYENFHNDISSILFTIEHILRVQWYLKSLNIDYFMTTYMDIFKYDYLINHNEVKYLYDIIDFSKFLPVKGCFEWVKENYPIEGFNPPDEQGRIGDHPTPFGHEKFSNELILPYLKNKNIINEY